MRISLLAGELQAMRLSSSGALLSGAASSRLFQLVTSVLTLLFTTSSIVSHPAAAALSTECDQCFSMASATSRYVNINANDINANDINMPSCLNMPHLLIRTETVGWGANRGVGSSALGFPHLPVGRLLVIGVTPWLLYRQDSW